MRFKSIALVVAVGLVGALVVPTIVPAAKVQLEANLKGKNEVPGPGDPDGSGRTEVKLRQSKGKICSVTTHSNIEPPKGGGIYVGTKGKAEGLFIKLFKNPEDPQRPGGCVDAPKKKIAALAANPNHYHISIQTPDYPNGAIRGQLKLRPGT